MDKAKFTEALDELITLSMQAGLHTAEMIGPLKTRLLEVRQMSMTRAEDDEHNAKHGLKPVTEAEWRKLLELEDHEPMPPRRP